jgi:hypothetical protein
MTVLGQPRPAHLAFAELPFERELADLLGASLGVESPPMERALAWPAAEPILMPIQRRADRPRRGLGRIAAVVRRVDDLFLDKRLGLADVQ